MRDFECRFYPVIIGVIAFLSCTNLSAGGDYFKNDRLLFDFYAPQWLNTTQGVQVDPSFSFAIAYGSDIQIKKSRFSLFYGLGYDFHQINHNVNFKNSFLNGPNGRDIGLSILNIPFELNRLSTQFIEIPLEFRFRTQTKNPFRIYLGTKVGYMVKSKYRLTEVNKNDFERVGLNELERWKYGVTARIGYGLFNVYAYYGLNALTNYGSEPNFNQLSLGLTLMAN